LASSAMRPGFFDFSLVPFPDSRFSTEPPGDGRGGGLGMLEVWNTTSPATHRDGPLRSDKPRISHAGSWEGH
jgi:hypothetical protein